MTGREYTGVRHLSLNSLSGFNRVQASGSNQIPLGERHPRVEPDGSHRPRSGGPLVLRAVPDPNGRPQSVPSQDLEEGEIEQVQRQTQEGMSIVKDKTEDSASQAETRGVKIEVQKHNDLSLSQLAHTSSMTERLTLPFPVGTTDDWRQTQSTTELSPKPESAISEGESAGGSRLITTNQATDMRQEIFFNTTEIEQALKAVYSEELVLNREPQILSAGMPLYQRSTDHHRLIVSISSDKEEGVEVAFSLPDHLCSEGRVALFAGYSIKEGEKHYRSSVAWKQPNLETGVFEWRVHSCKTLKPVSTTSGLDLDHKSKGSFVAFVMAVHEAVRHMIPIMRPDAKGKKTIIVFGPSQHGMIKLRYAQSESLRYIPGTSELITLSQILLKENTVIRFHCLPDPPVHAGQKIARDATRMAILDELIRRHGLKSWIPEIRVYFERKTAFLGLI